MKMVKLLCCDGCDKMKRSVISCGRDANGEPEAPDLCSLCRKEMANSKIYSKKLNKYVSIYEHIMC